MGFVKLVLFFAGPPGWIAIAVLNDKERKRGQPFTENERRRHASNRRVARAIFIAAIIGMTLAGSLPHIFP